MRGYEERTISGIRDMKRERGSERRWRDGQKRKKEEKDEERNRVKWRGK